MSSSPPDRKSIPRLEGKRLGRYQILGHVAAGGMATVHVARAEGTFGFERLVAVKVLHAHLANEDELVTMFVDEAHMAARIRHPKVVSVLDVADDPEEGLYLVMDYVEGDHLGTILKALTSAREPMPTRIAIRIVLDLLEGLEAAHELEDDRGNATPIIHRDVTPHNLLVGVDGVTRLSDFGIARAEARISQTRDGQFKGKLSYMAPEQIHEGVADARTDLFSAGIVLYECLTTTRLFRGDTTADILRKLLYDPIPSITEIRPDLAPLALVLERALSRDPNARYQRASELAEAIETAAASLGGVAQPREVGELVRRTRGDVLAERSARFRAAAEQLGSAGDITVTSRGRTIDLTQPGRPTPSLPPPIPEDARIKSRRPKKRVAATVVALCALVGAGLGYARVRSTDAEARVGASSDGASAPLRDSPPVLEHGLVPIVPSSEVSISPTVVARVVVGVDGRVREARIASPRPDLAAFERVALAAVRGYRFRPAIRRGEHVEGSLDLPIRFNRFDDAEHVARIKGSDTIGGALAPALADAFRVLRPDIRVEVEALGSSTAFVGLFDGSADLGASSRPIKPAELEEARRLGLVLEETVIGHDGIAILVHRDNPMTSITLAQLAQLYAGRTTDLAALGGPRGRPRLIGRPSYSGTHGFFEDTVLEPNDLAFGSVEDVEHSEAIIGLVASDPLAVAYVGAAYVNDSVRVVPVVQETGGSAVLPNEVSIRNGTYPIVRPLLVYTRGAPSGAGAEFLRFVLSARGRSVVRAHGFVASEFAFAAGEGNQDVPEARTRTLERIVFPMGQTRAPVTANDAIQRILVRLVANPDARVVIAGHADSEGTEPDNVRIGLARASSVADTFRRNGIPDTRIEVQSRGSTAPVATNDTEAGRANNRRVDVLVIE